MTPSPVRVCLLARSTVLEFDSAETVTLPVGLRDLTEDVLRHEPPTPSELERAIDVVEDALSRSRLAHGVQGELVTAEAVLLSLPGLDVPGVSLTRHDVESLFQGLASRALGMPASAVGSAHGRKPPPRSSSFASACITSASIASARTSPDMASARGAHVASFRGRAPRKVNFREALRHSRRASIPVQPCAARFQVWTARPVRETANGSRDGRSLS